MITPMDIHNKTFSKQIRGYSSEEVNSFLEELAGDYERIYREHREMEEEMDAIKTKLRNYEKMEETMSSTLVMAQQTAENVKRNANKEAELSIREAQNEARKIVSDAEAARRKMNADLLKTEGDMNPLYRKAPVQLQIRTLPDRICQSCTGSAADPDCAEDAGSTSSSGSSCSRSTG